MTLPHNDTERKKIHMEAPWQLFPKASLALVKHIQFGANKYCNGEIKWDRSQSPDEIGSLSRHLYEQVQAPTNWEVAVAILWRAYANCEKVLEGKAKFEIDMQRLLDAEKEHMREELEV